MRKFFVFLICGLFFCFMLWIIPFHDYTNKGKKALINSKDTCIIISEQEYVINIFGIKNRNTLVLYRSNEGKYVEQMFYKDMITIIK